MFHQHTVIKCFLLTSSFIMSFVAIATGHTVGLGTSLIPNFPEILKLCTDIESFHISFSYISSENFGSSSKDTVILSRRLHNITYDSLRRRVKKKEDTRMFRDGWRHRQKYAVLSVIHVDGVSNLNTTAEALLAWPLLAKGHIVDSASIHTLCIPGSHTNLDPGTLRQLDPNVEINNGREPYFIKPYWNFLFLLLPNAATDQAYVCGPFQEQGYDCTNLGSLPNHFKLALRFRMAMYLYETNADFSCDESYELIYQKSLKELHPQIYCTLSQIANVTIKKGEYFDVRIFAETLCIQHQHNGACSQQIIGRDPLPTVRSNTDVYMEMLTYNFISCYSQEEDSVFALSRPFQWNTWILIVVAIIAITKLSMLYAKRPCGWSEMFLDVIGTVLSQSASNISWVRGRSAKVLLISWLSATLVFSTSYLSIFVRDMSLPSTTPILNTFLDIRCNSTIKIPSSCTVELYDSDSCTDEIYNRYESWFANGSEYQDDLAEKQCFSFLSKPKESKYVSGHDPLRFELSEFVEGLKTISLRSDPSAWIFNVFYGLTSPDVLIYPKAVLDKEVWHTYEYWNEIDQELTKCGKSVLLASGDELQKNHEYLRGLYPALHFYFGKQPISAGWRRWNFMTLESSKVYKAFVSLVESGLFYKIREMDWYIARDGWFVKVNQTKIAARGNNYPKPLKLSNGRLIATFFILVIFSVFGLLMFGIELSSHIIQPFKNKEKPKKPYISLSSGHN